VNKNTKISNFFIIIKRGFLKCAKYLHIKEALFGSNIVVMIRPDLMSPSYVMNISSFLHQHRKDFKLLSVTEYRFFAQKADDPIFQGFKSFYHRQCFENFSYWQDQLIEK
jgi:hypothetical protein